MRLHAIVDQEEKRPSMFKLAPLFNPESRKALNGLAKYVYQAFIYVTK